MIEIPIDAAQHTIDALNARRYRKATSAEILKFNKYPYGLPRIINSRMPLMEKTTGLIWTLTNIGIRERQMKLSTMKAEPWRLELGDKSIEIWGDSHELARLFEAPEMASCPALWLGFGI